MKQDVKQKWVKALRSGKYRQIDGALNGGGCDPDGFCCLGVLCDIYSKETKVGKFDEAGEFVTPTRICAGFPSKSVYEWAGLHHETGKRLAGKNDGGESFAQIADYIEKRL